MYIYTHICTHTFEYIFFSALIFTKMSVWQVISTKLANVVKR